MLVLLEEQNPQPQILNLRVSPPSLLEVVVIEIYVPLGGAFCVHWVPPFKVGKSNLKIHLQLKIYLYAILNEFFIVY